MNSSNMKNMIVLKNLPSNIVEEAIIILKEKQKIKKLKYVPKESTNNKEKKDDKYIIKEAEMIVSEYISNCIQNKKEKEKNLVKKYKRMSTLASILAIICWIEMIFIIV